MVHVGRFSCASTQNGDGVVVVFRPPRRRRRESRRKQSLRGVSIGQCVTGGCRCGVRVSQWVASGRPGHHLHGWSLPVYPGPLVHVSFSSSARWLSLSQVIPGTTATRLLVARFLAARCVSPCFCFGCQPAFRSAPLALLRNGRTGGLIVIRACRTTQTGLPYLFLCVSALLYMCGSPRWRSADRLFARSKNFARNLERLAPRFQGVLGGRGCTRMFCSAGVTFVDSVTQWTGFSAS